MLSYDNIGLHILLFYTLNYIELRYELISLVHAPSIVVRTKALDHGPWLIYCFAHVIKPEYCHLYECIILCIFKK